MTGQEQDLKQAQQLKARDREVRLAMAKRAWTDGTLPLHAVARLARINQATLKALAKDWPPRGKPTRVFAQVSMRLGA